MNLFRKILKGKQSQRYIEVSSSYSIFHSDRDIKVLEFYISEYKIRFLESVALFVSLEGGRLLSEDLVL